METECEMEFHSLVFPRNQFNDDYIEIAKDNGFLVVRSNSNVWFWKRKEGKITSLLRAIDTLFPFSKTLCYSIEEILRKDGVVCFTCK